MGLLDEALAYTPDNIDGTDLSFVDGDTASNASGSKSYRLEGIEAAEVEKIIHGKYKPGEAGGAATTDIMRETANKLGFTNVKLKFNPDGSPEMDTLGKRQMFDLVNDEGDSYMLEPSTLAYIIATWISLIGISMKLSELKIVCLEMVPLTTLIWLP
mgnify:CR=1 FL=1